ncbi:MAG: phosphoribosyltransferase family protein [Bacillota bacterium]
MRFADRTDAGRRLASRLLDYAGQPGVVLGIPRGGVVVAAEVARRLALPLGIVPVKKVPCPLNPELAVGAVAADGSEVINREAVRTLLIDEAELRASVAASLEEARRRDALYRWRPPPLEHKVAIVVDDGLATGYTAMAAVRYVRRLGARPIVVAAPVAARLSAVLLASECDRLVTLMLPDDLESVGAWYDNFSPTTDEQVIALLQAFSAPPTSAE